MIISFLFMTLIIDLRVTLSGKIRTHSLVRVEGLKLSQTTLKKARCMVGKCHANCFMKQPWEKWVKAFQ